MEIKSPKEMVADVTKLTDDKSREALMLKTKSTVHGAFWGGAFGLMYGFYKNQNKYASALVGVLIGAIASNILTVKE